MKFIPQTYLVLSAIMFSHGVTNANSYDQECYPNFPIRDGIFCYPKCKQGFANYGQGPLCWGICPKGTTNIGVSCQKHSYGRGPGVVGTCRKGMEKNGALCYPMCKSGYYGVGPVCWKYCKNSEIDDGALCRQPLRIYRRNTRSCPWYDKCGLCGGPWYNKCGKRRNCGAKCKTGYTNDGCTCRRALVVYAKHSYGRGAGKVPKCSPGQEKNGVLCYKKCRSGYYGVGPVCWSICSGETYDTGAYCQKRTYGRGPGKPLRCLGIISKGYLKRVDISNITNLLKNINRRTLTKAVCLSLWSVSKPVMKVFSSFSTCHKQNSWNTMLLSISGGASLLLSRGVEIGLAFDVKSNNGACYVQHCTGFSLDGSADIAVNFGWLRSLRDIPGISHIAFGSFKIPFTKAGISFAGITNSVGQYIGTLSGVGLGYSLSPLPFSAGGGRCNTPKHKIISFTS